MVVGPDSAKRKPDPEAITKILDRFETSAERALMVGDSYSDIQAAKAAKTLSCGVAYGFGGLKELKEAGPNFIINKPEELIIHIE
ncbi:MAG: HAD-IA family hydrolase, partial [Deltaproteobacteria bacterium]|nr:HAD-IA family hydrolase [Deltaproteobacteria bacterium]